jgi:hypothetical protein
METDGFQLAYLEEAAAPAAFSDGFILEHEEDGKESEAEEYLPDWLDSDGFELDIDYPNETDLVKQLWTDGFSLDAEVTPSHASSSNSTYWNPGVDTGKLLARKVAPVSQQGQVLIANVYLSMKKIGASTLKGICQALGQVCSNHAPLPRRAASAVLCISPSTVRDVVARLVANAWTPKEPCMHQHLEKNSNTQSAQNGSAETPDEQVKVMKVLVREALYNSVRARPDVEFLHSLCRLSLNGVPIGQKYSNHHFVEVVEMLAGRYSQVLDSEILLKSLPGLGVQPPLGIMFDTVSLGCASFSRHETLEVVVLNLVNPRTGRLSSFLAGTPSVLPSAPLRSKFFITSIYPKIMCATMIRSLNFACASQEF